MAQKCITVADRILHIIGCRVKQFVGRAHGAHGGGERCAQGSSGET